MPPLLPLLMPMDEITTFRKVDLTIHMYLSGERIMGTKHYVQVQLEENICVPLYTNLFLFFEGAFYDSKPSSMVFFEYVISASRLNLLKFY